mmetsp:Transcript_3995/g.7008  ORF Transcript_3995/g.7008 Transcript_3995/m.7008 type:complete len:251 (-) Transcript_3995:475-1227(-)
MAQGILRGFSVWVESENDIQLLRSHVVGFGSLSITRFATSEFNSQNSIKQHLQLSLYEAYYAAFDLDVHPLLKILYDSPDKSKNPSLHTPEVCWNKFREMDKFFPQKYVAYHSYRIAGWAPHSGLKFGCDFVLYDQISLMKTESKHAHAPFCVRFEFISESTEISILSNDLQAFIAQLRVAHSVVKRYIICQIIYPSESALNSSQEARDSVKLKEIMLKRWIPSQNVEQYPGQIERIQKKKQNNPKTKSR